MTAEDANFTEVTYIPPVAETALLPFGDASLIAKARALNEAIEALPTSIHATHLRTFTYDTLIALMSLQQTGDYSWPQPQFQPIKETLEEAPNPIVDSDEPAGKSPVTLETNDSEVVEVPSMEVLSARLHQALVDAKIDFPELSPAETEVVQKNLSNFLKDPLVNTNLPFLIPDPNDPDHLLKVTFEGFKISVESTLPQRKPDQPLTPVEVMSNPINSLPIMAFFSMEELLNPEEPEEFKRMDVYTASYPKAIGAKQNIFDKIIDNIPRDSQGNPKRRSTDIIGESTL